MQNQFRVSLLLAFLLTVYGQEVSAQCKQWTWPEDRKPAEERVALLQDAMNNKKYKQAIKPFNWLVQNAPQINVSLYIHGANIYNALAGREKDPDIKKRYADSLMIVYNLRMKQCGQRGLVLNFKSLYAFKYYINGPEMDRVLPLMDSAFAVNGTKILDALLLPYMQTIVITQSKRENLSDDAILARYDVLTKIIDDKMNLKKDNAKVQTSLNQTKKSVDEWLFKVVKPDCDFVKKNLAPKFKKTADSLVVAKRIFGYMLQGKCTDDPLWIEAGKMIFVQERDFGLGKNIALRMYMTENNDEAERYFGETLPLAPTRRDSSEIYYYQGALRARKADKAKAREFYLISLKLDPTRDESYERIGDLYYSSFEECSRKASQADDRTVYLAAYDYYARAGNQKKMAMAKQSFPSKEEIFLLNYKVGDKLKVHCWINEDVVIRTRD